MSYQLNNCPVCGCKELSAAGKEIAGEDVFIVYKCACCDEIVSAYSAIRERQILEERKKQQPRHEMINRAETLDGAEIFNRNKERIVCVYSVNHEKNIVCGTGFIVSEKGYVLTNAHIISEKEQSALGMRFNDSITAKFAGSKEYHELEIVSMDMDKDIALLKFSEDYPVSAVSFCSAQQIKTGERVYAIGNCKGEGISITEGVIGDNSRIINGEKRLLVSVFAENGNSGGPVFNSRNQVVGMITFRRKDTPFMNYALPSDEIINFLDKAQKDENFFL
ncbi:MAG: S1 family peptidase [Christensenellales bacterium]|jgi:S1-C subfamily serine protease|nr:trypsin-like peptidase domain-containing protein [Clostridiales bacterium]